MKGYEVYVGDKALRVVEEGYALNFVNAKIEGLICDLDFALKNCSKPFITFGLPKRLKKYVEKRAKNFVSMSDDTKYKLSVFVGSPEENDLLQVYNLNTKTMRMSEKNKKKWHSCSNYLMTVEQARVYQEYFPENYFIVMEEDLEEFSKTGIESYELC